MRETPPRLLALQQASDLIHHLRPAPGEAAELPLESWLDALAEDPHLLRRWRATVDTLTHELHSAQTLSSVGILGEEPLVAEAGRRLSRRVLPDAPDTTHLDGVLHALFPRSGDADWLAALPRDTWARLARVLDPQGRLGAALEEGRQRALTLLAHRIAAEGSKPDLVSRMEALDLPTNPFLWISGQILQGHGSPELRTCTARGRQAIQTLRARKHEVGTSLRLTAATARLLGQLDRLDALLDPDWAPHLVPELVRALDERDHFLPLLRQHGDVLLYQVVERAADSGKKYITRTRGEYLRFLLSSMGGGLIVAFFALAKLDLSALDLAPAAKATLYSLNYAVAFVLIYITGATLATKQPGVTAHTLAATLDGPDPDQGPVRLAERIAQASRSQFVSFLGNLAVAFPVGLLLAMGWQQLFGRPLVAEAEAAYLLAEVHPWQSGSLWFAAVAGFFLFAAGLVAGWVDNHLVYARIPGRIAQHPALVSLVGEVRALGLATLVQKKAGPIVGSVFLGLALGSAGTLGYILGLPFDIRHVAFASAHLAMGLEGMDWTLATTELATLGLGVAAIGLVNFLVSFGLALAMAMESRGIDARRTRDLALLVATRLWRRPLDFFLPLSEGRGEGAADLSRRTSPG